MNIHKLGRDERLDLPRAQGVQLPRAQGIHLRGAEVGHAVGGQRKHLFGVQRLQLFGRQIADLGGQQARCHGCGQCGQVKRLHGEDLGFAQREYLAAAQRARLDFAQCHHLRGRQGLDLQVGERPY